MNTFNNTELAEKQFNETPKGITQHKGCVNGTFHFCQKPANYDDYGLNEKGEQWQFSFTQPDNFGNLVPVDCFYYGWTNEQSDFDLETWVGGEIGTDVAKHHEEWRIHEGQHIVDKFLNVSKFTDGRIDRDLDTGTKTEFRLVSVSQGPYSPFLLDGWYTLEDLEYLEVSYFKPF